MVKREIGSERLLRDYLLLKVEKKVFQLTIDQYRRLIVALADRQYIDDSALWKEYLFKYLYETQTKGVERTFTNDEARRLWDAYIYLKLKCPTLDVRDAIARIESFLPKQVQINESQ